MDIEALLTRIAKGDRSAYGGVVQHFQRPLFAYLGRMGLHQGQAEDIAQETFLRAWRRLGDYDPARAAFSTWLFTIARNLALNELTRAGAKHEVAMTDGVPDVASDSRGDPAQALLDAQRRARLIAALRALPVEDRSALALAYFSELDTAAIARIEGCSAGAVKVRIHRARQRLRRLLDASDG